MGSLSLDLDRCLDDKSEVFRAFLDFLPLDFPLFDLALALDLCRSLLDDLLLRDDEEAELAAIGGKLNCCPAKVMSRSACGFLSEGSVGNGTIEEGKDADDEVVEEDEDDDDDDVSEDKAGAIGFTPKMGSSSFSR